MLLCYEKRAHCLIFVAVITLIQHTLLTYPAACAAQLVVAPTPVMLLAAMHARAWGPPPPRADTGFWQE